MTEKEYKVLTNCVELQTRTDGEEFYCMKDDTPKDVKQLLRDSMFENDQRDLNLSYEMLNDALNCLSEIEFKDLNGFDVYQYDGEFASVYTQTRLGYINNWNQDEITEKLKEYSCDIQTACAIWYDNQVKTLINTIKDKIVELQ